MAQRYDLPKAADALFTRYGTTDFEKVLYQLHESAWLTQEYGYDSDEMEADYDELKRAFIEAITEVHPARSWDMEEDQVSRIGGFLERFYMVGSVSYDLVLYWLLVRYMKDVKLYYNSFWMVLATTLSEATSSGFTGLGQMPNVWYATCMVGCI